MTADNYAALVLFSGGQDSATCLAWAPGPFRAGRDRGFSRTMTSRERYFFFFAVRFGVARFVLLRAFFAGPAAAAATPRSTHFLSAASVR